MTYRKKVEINHRINLNSSSNFVTIVTRSELTKLKRKYSFATLSDAKQELLRHRVSKKILLERGTQKGFLFIHYQERVAASRRGMKEL